MKTFLDYVKSHDTNELKRQVEHLSKMASEHEEKANAALMMGDRDGHSLHMAKHEHFKTQHENLKSGLKEEVEQINELSPKTIASYSDKAYKDYSQRLRTSADEKKYDPKTTKRFKGLTKATSRGPKTHQVPAGKSAVDKSGRPYWGEDVEQVDEVAAWQRKEGKSESGGLNKKGIASYRRENPGSKLSMAVTTKPSKLKPGSKSANRRKSFCARMGGMKKRLTSAKTARDPDSRINKALRKWNC
jgi:rubrerythrin